MSIVEKYISGLKNAYLENGGVSEWEVFASVIHGASEENIDKLKELYPEVPDGLIELLQYVDGTYWREYAGKKLVFYLLGSDVDEYEYPYYLLSSSQIVENKDIVTKYFSDYICREYEEVKVDDKITSDIDSLKWLHFSDCMNNGGTSKLFIDFSPSDKGKKGQIVRFLHDPDELCVIADSFEDYLTQLIKHDYDFIMEDYFNW